MRKPHILASAVIGLSAPALAALSQAVIVAPGGFVQTAGFPMTCCGFPPGADISASNGAPQDFHEQAFAGAGSAMQSSSYSSAGIINGATASARMGIIGMTAHNTSPDASTFPVGVGNGGWKEIFTVNHPGLTGQAGFMVFQLRARGSMNVSGLTGSAFLTTSGFKDNAELVQNAYFNIGNSDPVAPGTQRCQWRLASFGLPDSRVVDSVVTMAVPITFGQSFTLGIYAAAVCSQRSSGGVGGTSNANLNFGGDGVIWNGIVSVQSGGSPVTGYTVISGTSTNWNVPQGCYANCDGSTTAPALNVQDFSCFLNAFAAGQPYANCDGSTTPPTLNVQDFSCFLNAFAAGCP